MDFLRRLAIWSNKLGMKGEWSIDGMCWGDDEKGNIGISFKLKNSAMRDYILECHSIDIYGNGKKAADTIVASCKEAAMKVFIQKGLIRCEEDEEEME